MSACEWIILIAFEIFSLPSFIFFFHQRPPTAPGAEVVVFIELSFRRFKIDTLFYLQNFSAEINFTPSTNQQRSTEEKFSFRWKSEEANEKKESSLKTSWWEFPPMELGVCNKNHLFIWWMYLDHGNMRSIFYVFLPFNLSSVDKVDVDGSRRELYPHRCTLNPLRRRLWRGSASETFGNKTELLLFFFLCVYASNNDGWDCLGGDRRKRAREKYHL